MTIREGRWDCPSCGRTGNLGRHQHCEGCGDPRPERVRFYLPGDAPAVQDPRRLTEAAAGPDRLCDHCGASNRGDAAACSQCGAELDPRRHRPVRLTSVATPAKFFEASYQHMKARAAEQPWPAPRPSYLPRALAGLGALLGVIFLLWLAWGCTRRYEYPGSVASVRWERWREVEALRTETEEGWRIPSGGRELRRWRAVHHYDQVVDRYETRTRTVREQTGVRQVRSGSRDLDNGYFEDVYSTEPIYESRLESYQEPVYRSEPVYRTRYRYEIDRWRVVRTERAAGDDLSPRNPEVTLARGERLGRAGERYTVALRAAAQDYRREVGLAEFSDYRPGRPCTVVVNWFNVLCEVRWK